MAQDDNQQLNPELVKELKERYYEEYKQAATDRLGLMDAFRSAKSREKKVERLTEKMLDADITTGELQKRAAKEIAFEDTLNKIRANRIPSFSNIEEGPGNFDFLGMTGTVNLPSGKSFTGDYNVDLPAVDALRAAPVENFLGYVLDSVARYQIGAPTYQAVDEVRGGKKGEIIGTIMRKKFNISAAPAGMPPFVERTADVKESTLYMHSTPQKGLLALASHIVHGYNETGEISQDLRDRFMFEQTKDELRNQQYPFTRKYETFCRLALDHVLGKIKGVEQKPEQTYHPMAAGVRVGNVTVTYNPPKPKQ